MANYPDDITRDTLPQLLARRELLSLTAGPHRTGDIDRSTIGLPGDLLKINSYQLFIRGLINPNTPYRKIHLAWAPGIGKTVGALVAAHEFIGVYRQLYAAETMVRARFRAGRAAAEMADIRTPSVFILGFAATETAFVRDLLGYSYFGFVSQAEREELNFRRAAASGGSEADQKALQEYESRLRRRLSDKSRGGFYKFLGYEKFVNRLFSSTGIDFVELEREVQDRRAAGNVDIDLQDIIDEYIAAGKIAINQELLTRLENSLLICDEIHDTYNKTMKNNRGVAIQYVLNRVKTLRFISMSATPVNNSPMEVVDFANYFIDNRADQLRRRDLFDGRKLRPGALERIGSVMFGKVSFVQDTDTRYYPSSEIAGDPLVLPSAVGGFAAGSTLPYLRFLQVPMTKLQMTALDEYMRDVEARRAQKAIGGSRRPRRAIVDVNETADEVDATADADADANAAAYANADVDDAGGFPLPADGFTVYDMVFPIPQPPGVSFRSSIIRSSIDTASTAWRREAGVATVVSTGGASVYGGDWLRRDTIAQYSSKYARLLDDLDALYSRGPSKALIYHYRVEMAGAVFIAELLRANGYIDEHGNATSSTRCVYCGKTMAEHDVAMPSVPAPATAHSYAPIRYILAYHSAPNLKASIERFRSADNADGSKYAIMIGSEIIKQSYDFKCVQTLYVLSLSTSIRILLQVFGRAIRKDSHALLPPDKRHVTIKILLQTRDDGVASPEVLRYAAKMDDHLTVQQIMRELNAGAADAWIDRAINMSPALMASYFPNGRNSAPVARIDTLYYEPITRQPDAGGMAATATYYAHRHYRRDMEDIAALVKWAFMRRNVWQREDLYAYVSRPTSALGTEVDPRGFTRDQFAVVMRYLCARQQMVIGRIAARADIANIYDYVSKYVYVNGIRCTVVAISDMYVAIPIDIAGHSGRAARASGSEEPIVDAETFLRMPPARTGVVLTIADIDGSTNMQYSRALAAWTEAARESASITAFLTATTGEMQVAMLREIIENGSDVPRADEIVTLLRGLNALVTYKQVALFKDVAEQFSKDGPTPTTPTAAGSGTGSGKPTTPMPTTPTAPGTGSGKPTTPAPTTPMPTTPMPTTPAPAPMHDDTIVGYTEGRAIWLYNGARWFTVKRAIMNRATEWREAVAPSGLVAIGSIETVGIESKLKLRKSLEEIRGQVRSAGESVDTRTVDRGMICGTKSRQQLTDTLIALGGKIPERVRIRGLCDLILDQLVVRETAERGRKTKTKYLYGWWDEPLNVKSAV